ncbi:MAG: GMP/IMP nucleotidase [Gammaproteobacteria bacterium]|nr:GMP/IMP nucleotidase [Gammaproteobacteria bacterium]
MINWSNIKTILLDMDGTLLDLNFDNYFWQHHVPLRYAQKHAMELDAAKDILVPLFRKIEGTMDWYCVDHWTRELGMDIELLKQEVDHLIAVHPHVIDFLVGAKSVGKRVVLVTNAHGKSLRLKMKRTELGKHFDEIICAHDFGLPKEDVNFWDKLQVREPFEKSATLLVDDSLAVLRSAKEYGIAYLLAVNNPDTKQPSRNVQEFDAVNHFRDLLPIL